MDSTFKTLCYAEFCGLVFLKIGALRFRCLKYRKLLRSGLQEELLLKSYANTRKKFKLIILMLKTRNTVCVTLALTDYKLPQISQFLTKKLNPNPSYTYVRSGSVVIPTPGTFLQQTIVQFTPLSQI
jgi:hypothetical protein